MMRRDSHTSNVAFSELWSRRCTRVLPLERRLFDEEGPRNVPSFCNCQFPRMTKKHTFH
jgi:hypothetical protein